MTDAADVTPAWRHDCRYDATDHAMVHCEIPMILVPIESQSMLAAYFNYVLIIIADNTNKEKREQKHVVNDK